jgi:hypothetical protein
MTLLRRTRFHAVGDICMGASQETYFEGFDAEMNQQNKKLSAIPNSWLTRTLVDRQGTRDIYPEKKIHATLMMGYRISGTI